MNLTAACGGDEPNKLSVHYYGVTVVGMFSLLHEFATYYQIYAKQINSFSPPAMRLAKYFLILWCGCLERSLAWDEHINRLEDLVLFDLYKGTMKNVWISMVVDDEVLACHYLEPTEHSPDKPDIVLIHGYGATSALAWRGVIPRIVNDFNVYAIDIPGLGRTIPHSKLLAAENAAQTQDMICHYFNELYKVIGLSRPYVVAHSLGAYMFIHCVDDYPSLASRLLIADAPGFFPSSGGFDYLWATFFVIGLPHAPIQLLGDFGKSVVEFGSRLLGLNVSSFYVDYWHSVQSNPIMQAHKIVQKFIDHKYLYAHGVGSPLYSLLNLTIPVATLYGSEDNISPAHQGELIYELSGIKNYK